MLKLGVLGSGRGSNFVAIADAIEAGKLDAEIRVVGSDFSDAPILDEARRRGYEVYGCPKSQFKTKLEPEIETELAQVLLDAKVEVVVLAGFMRVIKAPLLEAFPKRIINIHPSLLPDFKGLEAWKQALEAGVAETGCTVHWVNEEIDGGAILGQEKVPVEEGDTAERLHARIQVAEHELYPAVLKHLAAQWKGEV